jgi:hypothetical protein
MLPDSGRAEWKERTMPSFQVVAEKFNAILRSEKAADIRNLRALFESDRSVAEIATEMELARGEQVEFLSGMPDGMAAALKALIAANLGRDRPYGMQVVPFVGPEWEFLISEVAPTGRPESRGTISLMLRCPKL